MSDIALCFSRCQSLMHPRYFWCCSFVALVMFTNTPHIDSVCVCACLFQAPLFTWLAADYGLFSAERGLDVGNDESFFSKRCHASSLASIYELRALA